MRSWLIYGEMGNDDHRKIKVTKDEVQVHSPKSHFVKRLTKNETVREGKVSEIEFSVKATETRTASKDDIFSCPQPSSRILWNPTNFE